MSTPRNLTSTLFDIKADPEKFKPTTFEVNDQFLYCVAGDDQNLKIKIAGPDETVVQDAKINKAEQKLMNHTFIEQALGGAGVDIFAGVSDNSFLVREQPTDSAQRHTLACTKYSAIIVTWNGRGYPPDGLRLELERKFRETLANEGEFSRIWNKTSDRSAANLRWHWTRVDLIEYDESYCTSTKLQEVWQKLSDSLDGETQFTLHHVPMKMHTTVLTLSEVLQQVREKANVDYLAAQQLYSVAQAFLRKEYISGDLQVNHGHKFYDFGSSENNESIKGLTYSVGKHRQLSLNAGEPQQPVVHTGVCPKLFFEPGTAADFMLEYFGSTKTCYDRFDREQIEEALRGKMVCVYTDQGKLIKAVSHVSSSTVLSAAEEDKLLNWRGKFGSELAHPELPCLNIGTEHRALLLPPEVCLILPGQSFRRPYTPSLWRELGRVQKANSMNILGKTPINNVSFVVKVPKPPVNQSQKIKLDAFIEGCALRGSKVIFVEAGTAAMESALLKGFKQSLEIVKVLQRLKIDINKIDPLFLSHEPGEKKAKLWERQLKQAQNAFGSEAQKTVAVVCIQKDEYHAEIYETIKALCDIRLGIQTYFVNLNTLDQKAMKSPQAGIDAAAHELARRMVVRNPEPVSARATPCRSVTVAAHMGQIVQPIATMDTEGRMTQKTETSYLVVLSSRQTDGSAEYATRTKLISSADKKTFDLADEVAQYVKEVTQRGSSTGSSCEQVIILRSGFIFTTETSPSGGKLSREIPCHEQMKLYRSTVVDDPLIYSLRNQGLGPRHVQADKPSRSKLINDEAGRMVQKIKSCCADDRNSRLQVSYVLLSDDNNIYLSEEKKIQVAQQASEAAGNDKTNSSFFLVDTDVMNPSTNTICHGRTSNIKNNFSLVSLTLLGDPLADKGELPVPETPKKLSATPKLPYQGSAHSGRVTSNPETSRQPSSPLTSVHPNAGSGSSPKSSPRIGQRQLSGPKPRRKSSHSDIVVYNDENKDPARAVSEGMAKMTLSDHAEIPRSEISPQELAVLAKLWFDERLGLYNTKWPIPTHLAYLAAKRAQFHLKFIRKYEDPDNEGGAIALPAVHEDIAHTLYFL